MTRNLSWHRLFPFIVALAAVVTFSTASACDSDGDDDSTPANGTTLTVTSTFTPDPPVSGQNAMTVTVADANGAAVTGCVVVVDPQMPMHGHGSSETAVLTDNGDGTYEATPVTFQMPGAWVVTVTATKGEATGTQKLDVTIQ